jgi:ElaB/YqjD/DUF883 family membrane-anchored ribosome-binding protein
MSTSETPAKKTRDTILDTYELAEHLEAMRAELGNLTSTVSRIAGKQLGNAQAKARETAVQAGATITQNPLTALAIAVALGFLFGALTRR